LIDRRERVYQAFGGFLIDFIRDLNNSSEDGWSLLVEGPRDEEALRMLGYRGDLLTVSRLGRKGKASGCTGKVIILTDLDREGTVLASNYIKRLNHEGVKVSLRERRRLKAASRGVFLHIENLGRFARPQAPRWEGAVAGPVPVPNRRYREGLRRFHRRPAIV
jgi:5S rRNA maturation endonuclease (ribonuclease M5)